MLAESDQLQAAGRAAKHFTNPVLSASIEHAATAEHQPFLREVSMLNRAVRRINDLRSVDPALRDPELASVYSEDFPSLELPEVFAWKDDAELDDWNNSLMDTITTINQEAGAPNGYRDPIDIEEGNYHDVFRWYFMDGYALWAAKRSHPQDKVQEEKRAEVLVNALCEAAIVEAEEGSVEMKPYVDWLEKIDWLSAEYGFHANIEVRAKRISQASESSA